MTISWKYLVAFVTMVLFAPGLEAQEKAAAYPASAQMERYPIITDTAGHVVRMVEMGLHPCRLKTDWTGLNWYQNYQGARLGRFVYETLSTGTEAWCDWEEVPRYKADCVNRLATKDECPDCLLREPVAPLVRSDTVWVRFNQPEFVQETPEVTLPPIVVTRHRPWYSTTWGKVAIGVGTVAGGYVGYKCATDWCRDRINLTNRNTIVW